MGGSARPLGTTGDRAAPGRPWAPAHSPQSSSSGVMVATERPCRRRGCSQVAAACAFPERAYVRSRSASQRVSQSQCSAFESRRLRGAGPPDRHHPGATAPPPDPGDPGTPPLRTLPCS